MDDALDRPSRSKRKCVATSPSHPPPRCRAMHARSNAVWPLVFRRAGFARAARSSCTTTRWPCCAAKCNAVQPDVFRKSAQGAQSGHVGDPRTEKRVVRRTTHTGVCCASIHGGALTRIGLLLEQSLHFLVSPRAGLPH
eukprot:COSAG05_NODE_9161_length_643_cov_1.134191_1_plen_138_part_10